MDYIISEDGQKLVIGTSSLTFYLAPEHTDDGLVTVIEPAGIFLSGEYLSVVEFPFIFDSYLEYIKTMDKVKYIYSNHTISVHVPGHGHTTENKVEMQDRLKFSQEYLEQLLADQENIEKC